MTSHPYRAFQFRNYRAFFIGQVISLSGTWMQGVVQAWLVYRLTHSAQWLGVITFASQVPAFLLSPIAGIVADRFDRRRLLIWVLAVQMLQALLLAALVFSGKVEAWHIAVLATLLGVTNAFELTTRHSFAADMVPKADIPSVIALNSVAVNITRIIGPALGGLLLGALGEGGCFFLNALTYLAPIYSLWTMKLALASPLIAARPASVLHQLREAWSYVWRTRPIFNLLLFATFVSFVTFPYAVLLPVFAKNVLGGGAQTLAWLTSMGGVGAVFGVLGMGWGGARQGGLRKVLLIHTAITGIALIGLGLSRSPVLSFAAVFVIGCFLMTIYPQLNARIQQWVEDQMRGRVVAFYTMTFLGAVPLGSLVHGALADHFGAPAVAVGAGLITSGVALAVLIRMPQRVARCFSRAS